MKDGIIGVEYDSATGDHWVPAHVDHSLNNLDVYLLRSPPGEVEGVRRNIIGTGIWPVLHIVSARHTALKSVRLIAAVSTHDASIEAYTKLKVMPSRRAVSTICCQ